MKFTIKILSLLCAVFVLAFAPMAVKAFFHVYEERVNIESDKIIVGDYIAFGDIVDIKGKVDGDVISVGSNISITDSVSGDVIAAGSFVSIEGEVLGSVRVAGGSVEIKGEVGRNVNIFGGEVTLSEGAHIGRNVYIYGGVINVRGIIDGNLVVKGGKIVISDEVKGNIHADLGNDGKLILSPESKVGGTIFYKALHDEQLTISQGALIEGEPTFQQWERVSRKSFDNAYIFGKIVIFFGMLVIGLIFISLVPKKLFVLQADMKAHPWKNIFKGFVFVGITPLVIVLFFFTIIGIPLAFIILSLYFISLYVGKVLAGMVLGLIIFGTLNKGKKTKSLFLPTITGLLILVIITNISYIGFIINLLFIFWALGAMISEKWKEVGKWK